MVLTKINLESGALSWEIRNVISRPAPEGHRASVIAFPDFDDHRHALAGWFAAIEERGARAAIPEISRAYAKLVRIGKNTRHGRLAEFLHHVLIALENGDAEGAGHILLTALATFGWPSDLAAAP
jgi:hypothetical protein